MAKKQTYAVLGLGRFGRSLARELADNGAEVLGIDLDENIVNEVAETIPYCRCGNATDPEVLSRIGISNYDTVIISMAKHLEATVLAVMLCKEAGVPTVIVKCPDEMTAKIAKKIGADRTIIPEKESGIRLAKELVSGGILDLLDLSGDVSVAELEIRPEWIGKSLQELNLRSKYQTNVIAVKSGNTVQTGIDPGRKLEAGETLVVVANKDGIRKLR
ncbi:MAG: TrkA family potassium uptake protein [Clostridia bacterium]|nr:TrkA family potassium uptake protein [Clostridia bacterium]MBQ4289915.1 TrkA family potassium uptake protein [Clostridia bacterium]